MFYYILHFYLIHLIVSSCFLYSGFWYKGYCADQEAYFYFKPNGLGFGLAGVLCSVVICCVGVIPNL